MLNYCKLNNKLNFSDMQIKFIKIPDVQSVFNTIQRAGMHHILLVIKGNSQRISVKKNPALFTC